METINGMTCYTPAAEFFVNVLLPLLAGIFIGLLLGGD